MTKLKKPDNRVFIGKGGSGKSTLARRDLRAFKRVLVHDTAGEDENAAGALVTDTAADLVDRLVLAGAGPVRICWRGYAAGVPDAFEFANRAAWCAENVAILWEEADMYTGAGALPHWAHQLVHLGRHRRIRVFAAARRPHNLSRNLTANCQRFHIFKMTEPRDLKYLADVIGTENAAQLPGLKDHWHMAWSETGVKICKPIKIS